MQVVLTWMMKSVKSTGPHDYHFSCIIVYSVAYFSKFLQGRQKTYIWLYHLKSLFLSTKNSQILAISYSLTVMYLCDHTAFNV